MIGLDEVWSVPAVMAAATAGLLFAAYVWITHLRRPVPRGRGIAALVGVDCLIGAFLFTASQTAAALWVGDGGWGRILSRFGMWIPFALALSIGLYAVLRVRGAR